MINEVRPINANELRDMIEDIASSTHHDVMSVKNI